jgi:predicted acetyltransferase
VSELTLVWPTAEHLPSYIAALRRGWSSDNMRPDAAKDELARIAEDPRLFIARQVNRNAEGPPIVHPDGTTTPRLPGYRRWMWDGEFCGSIGFRWQPGTTDLPPLCLGHIGYGVVPWKRGCGYATRALGLFLKDVEKEGLPFVELTTNAMNEASRRVIEKNGGIFVERFRGPELYGSHEELRFRISLPRPTAATSSPPERAPSSAP